jgi:hypothetical protein
LGKSGTGVAATDVYEVECADSAVSLSAHVIDLAPFKLPIISIQISKGTYKSPLATDTVDGDARWSAWTVLPKGKEYLVSINKSASTVKGVELYSAQFKCLNAANQNVRVKEWGLKQNR